jgi:hypothetical protein
VGYQRIYNANRLREDVHICHTNFAKQMEQNLHETTSRWKTYGKRLFSEDLEVQDECVLYIYKFLFLRNTKISIFGGISKFHLWANFARFWEFWGVLGRFGQNLPHWQRLTACPNYG